MQPFAPLAPGCIMHAVVARLACPASPLLGLFQLDSYRSALQGLSPFGPLNRSDYHTSPLDTARVTYTGPLSPTALAHHLAAQGGGGGGALAFDPLVDSVARPAVVRGGGSAAGGGGMAAAYALSLSRPSTTPSPPALLAAPATYHITLGGGTSPGFPPDAFAYAGHPAVRDRGGAASAPPAHTHPGSRAYRGLLLPTPKSYAIKYYGVSHGMLGCLSVRKSMSAAGPPAPGQAGPRAASASAPAAASAEQARPSTGAGGDLGREPLPAAAGGSAGSGGGARTPSRR